MGASKRGVKRLRVTALVALAVVASFAGVVALEAVVGSETPALAGQQQEQEEQPIGGLPFLTETVLAAKIAALASGNVIAGPGQVYMTAKEPFTGVLWKADTGAHYAARPLKDVTLTVQKFGACDLGIGVVHAQEPGRVGESNMSLDDFEDQSSSISQVRAFRVDYFTTRSLVPCLFLWVLRETP